MRSIRPKSTRCNVWAPSEAGKTLGVIVVKIDLRKLEQSWQASGDAVWVTDKRSIIFLASTAKWHYFTLEPLSDDVKSELAQTRQYGSGPINPLRRVTEWQSDDWSTFDLDSVGPQLVFGSPIPDYPCAKCAGPPDGRARITPACHHPEYRRRPAQPG